MRIYTEESFWVGRDRENLRLCLHGQEHDVSEEEYETLKQFNFIKVIEMGESPTPKKKKGGE